MFPVLNSIFVDDEEWTLWGRWSICLGLCGQGEQYRRRTCSDASENYQGHAKAIRAEATAYFVSSQFYIKHITQCLFDKSTSLSPIFKRGDIVAAFEEAQSSPIHSNSVPGSTEEDGMGSHPCQTGG